MPPSPQIRRTLSPSPSRQTPQTQLSLLDLAPAVQRRRREREASDIYDAVLHLRRAGYTVYAEGLSHRVDGRLLDTEELLRFAHHLSALDSPCDG